MFTLKSTAFALTLSFLFLGGSHASILIGTLVTPQTENIGSINNMITSYNTNFSASLPLVVNFQDKLEDDGSSAAASFQNGFYQVADFTFYEQDDAGSTQIAIFDNLSVGFSTSMLGNGEGFDTIDNPVQGFQQRSGESVEYYVSKDGNLGWSLWYATSGFNPFYTDSAVGGFTYGSTTNDSLAYDPIKSGVSHLSFYSSGGSGDVPEPGTITIWSLVGIGAFALHRRRRPRAAVS